jgi:hypothetical protein
VRRWIPGFRSGTWWKAVIASLFYGFFLIGVVGGLVTAQWATAGFALCALAIAVLLLDLISYRHVRPANIVLLSGLLIAFAGCGISVANVPAQPASGHQQARAAPPPVQSVPPTTVPILATSPTASATSAPTPTPTASLTPFPSPTPTPAEPPTPVPTPVATPVPATAPPPPPPPPPPAANLCGAPPNPWSFNFCGGSTISSPPSAFCSYFGCIANFWNGRGFVIECNDGMYSKSGGIRGSCSYHGGDQRALYQ